MVRIIPIIIAVFCAVALAGLGYLNDRIQGLTYIIGNHLPISVFGLLILTVLLVNPLLRRVKLHLRPAELAIIVTLMLVVSSIPGSGLMRCFMPGITLPAHLNRQNVGWQKANVMSYVPPRMVPGGGEYKDDVINGFMNGIGLRKEFSIANLGKQWDTVPWDAWRSPLGFWLPLILLTSLAVICLGLIVHRQWSTNERLRYPIADFATALMAQDDHTGKASILRNKLFWIGLGAIFLIRVNNGIHVWNDNFVEIPLVFDLTAITQKWPGITQVPYYNFLTTQTFYPTVVAFAFFLASDVSFSLGVLQFFTVGIFAILLGLGVNVTGGYIQPSPQTWHLFGSYFGLALVILWVGRNYYVNVARQAVTFAPRRGVDRYAPWALRLLILALAAMVWILVDVGLEWTLAIMTVLLVMLIFFVMGRINAESGLFFVQPRWQPMTVMIGLLGVHAMGPKAIAITGLVCAVLTMDPRECMMPFLLNGLKMSEKTGIRPSRVGMAAPITFGLGLAAAAAVVLMVNYNYGGPTWDGWGFGEASRFGLNEVQLAVDKMNITKELASSVSLTPVERLTQIAPDGRFLWAFGLGFALVLVTSILRLRYTWWPLHPVLFLCWGTFPAMAFSASLLAGWVIKTGVTKFGGGQKYHQLKPMMIGVIAGDLLGGLAFMAYGLLQYSTTGATPKPYQIFPG